MAHNIVFSGSLLFVSLADVFQLLGDNNCTGILTLRSPHSADGGLVYFSGGNPINASYGNLKGLQAAYALFGWTDGKYEFSEEDLTGIDPVIKQGRMGIVMDALRLLDEGAIARVGPDPHRRPDMKKANLGMTTLEPVKGPMVDYLYVMGEYSYPDGATIVKEGKYGKWLWVIYEGVVRVIRETPKGAVTLARLGEGCFIGTIKALSYGDYQRNASVIAEGNVRLCILDIEPLQREYATLSQSLRKMLISLDNRTRLINDHVIQATIEGHPKALPQDKIFDDQFQKSSELYIIRKGTADIIGKGPKGDVNLLSLGVDDVFGKIPFVDFGHEPLSASVMTSKSFQADILDGLALEREYEDISRALRNFVFHTATSLSMTTKLLYQILDKL